MTNQYYTQTGNPPNQTRALSALMRAEFALLQTAFDKLPNINSLYSNVAALAVDTGTVNAMAVAVSSNLTSLADGTEVVVKVANTTTGTASIAVTGATFFGVKVVNRYDGSPTQPGDFVAGEFSPLRFNATSGSFQMVQPPPSSGANGLPLSGGTMSGAINEAKGNSIASASTVDLTGATGNLVHVTGNATINVLSLISGAERTVVFDGTPTLVYNAATLIIPGGGSILVAPGDVMKLRGDGLGIARIVSYQRADGTSLTPISYRYSEFFDASISYTATRDGPVRLTLVAAGGTGGVAIASTASNSSAAASGASGPGMSVKSWFMKAGETLTLILGLPGSAPSLSGNNLSANGNDGGTATASAPGISITVGGGKAGRGAVASGGGTANAPGQTGGTATGGDINFTGCSSGTAAASASSGTALAATGGATASYKGISIKSGDATATASGGGLAQAATGGNGVGGGSGNSTATSSGASFGSSSGGGGAVLPSSATVATGAGQSSAGGAGAPASLAQTPLTLNGSGTDGNSASSPNSGGGCGGVCQVNTSSPYTGPSASMLGGGSALTVSALNFQSFVGGAASYGSSSGAIATYSSSGVAASAGAAGKSFAIFEHN